MSKFFARGTDVFRVAALDFKAFDNSQVQLLVEILQNFSFIFLIRRIATLLGCEVAVAVMARSFIFGTFEMIPTPFNYLFYAAFRFEQ